MAAVLESRLLCATTPCQAFLIGFCPTVAANLNYFDAAELTKVVVAYSEWPGEVSTDSGQQELR